MLRKAVARLSTVSVKPEDTASLGSRELGAPMVIIPVVDAYQRLHGVVAINQIPFFSLTEKNLQLASIIASRFADYLRASEHVPSSDTAGTPDAASEALYWFVYQTLRCLDQANSYGLHAHILLNEFGNPTDVSEYVSTVESETRGLDHTLSWQAPDGRVYLLMLLPLTNPDGVNMFMARFDRYIETAHGVGLLDAEISTHRMHMQQDASIESITRFFDRFLGENNEISNALHKPDKEEGVVRASA